MYKNSKKLYKLVSSAMTDKSCLCNVNVVRIINKSVNHFDINKLVKGEAGDWSVPYCEEVKFSSARGLSWFFYTQIWVWKNGSIVALHINANIICIV